MQIIRRFECTKCNYIHVFAPKGSSRYKKKVFGFTCPRCDHRPTEAELAKKKGRGPKPKGERRKRSKKKDVVEETPIIVAPQPAVEEEEITWKTGDSPPGERRNRGYGTRRAGWKPKPRKPLQPVDRTLGEALGGSFQEETYDPMDETYDPISGLHSEDLEDLELEVNGELEKLKEERQALEGISKRMDKQEKKLVLMIVRLDRVEERLNAQVDKLCDSIEQLDSKIQSFSTLVSHMVSAQEPNRR